MNVDLEFVEKALSVLNEALMALGAFTPKDHAEDYQHDWAKHTFWTANGFVILKKAGQDHAARHMIRPVIETMLLTRAVKLKPQTLFRIICGELKADYDWLKAMDKTRYMADDCEQKLEDAIRSIAQGYSSEFPGHDISKTSKLDTVHIAEAGELLRIYNVHYRLYCRHTHGNKSMLDERYKDADFSEELTMATCIVNAIDAVVECGAPRDGYEALLKEFDEISAHFRERAACEAVACEAPSVCQAS
jgi:hypothetical protein